MRKHRVVCSWVAHITWCWAVELAFASSGGGLESTTGGASLPSFLASCTPPKLAAFILQDSSSLAVSILICCQCAVVCRPVSEFVYVH